MADLDDFFAKKDKKKSKKPKFLTAEELVKNLEETKREALVKPKKPEATPPAAADETTAVGEVEEKPKEPLVEDEWKEIEEEQRKDYSGLKIGQLTMNDDEDDSGSEGQNEDGGNDGNINYESSSKRSGGRPWKKVIPAEEVTQIPMEMPKPASKVYISPALRAAQQGMGPGLKPKIRNKNAPDITNADFFPTLGAARPEEQRKKKNEPAFEEVRHGGRVQRVKEQTAAPTAAANRFQSLDEAES